MFNWKVISALFLATAGLAAYETGPIDSVFRMPHSGTRPLFGSIDLSKSAAVGSSILPKLNGGTGIGAGLTNGQLPIGQTSDGLFTWQALTAGAGVTVTNGAHSITIAASAVSGPASVLTKTTNYTIVAPTDFDANDRLLVVANCSSACTLTLPAASSSGYDLAVMSIGAGVATLARAGSDTINGATSYPVGAGYSGVRMLADGGTKWHITSDSQGKGFVTASGANSTATVGNNTNYIFTASGTLTVTTAGFCKALLVAGGGAGNFGGGGGGGVIDHYMTDIYLVPGAYPVTVGAGGVAVSQNSCNPGGSGGNTTALGLTAVGGGGGGDFCQSGSNANGAGANGGSGGGGGFYNGNTASSTVATGTDYKPERQGYNGTVGALSTCYSSGGSGGAGAIGAFQGGCNGGLGGIGLKSMIANPISGTTYGGGGGGGQGNSGGSCSGSGGTGGAGGGGNGACSSPTAGTANTGGGGGGISNATGGTAANGGSGYAVISCPNS